MVIENGTIVYVGDKTGADVYRVIGTTRYVDLDGHVILPGFHDVHMHPLEAVQPAACILDSSKDLDSEEYLQEFATCGQYQIG